MDKQFGHEKLNVYQEAITFIAWVHDKLLVLNSSAAVKAQLDRASTSVALNIAEGNGKFTKKDKSRFFDIAYGSALECSACLDVLFAKKMISENDVASGKVFYATLYQCLSDCLKIRQTEFMNLKLSMVLSK